MAEVEPPKDAATQTEWQLGPFRAFLAKGKLTDIARGVIWGFRFMNWSQNACSEMFSTVSKTMKRVDTEMELAVEALAHGAPGAPRGYPGATLPGRAPDRREATGRNLNIAEGLEQRERSAQTIRKVLKERTGEVWSVSTVLREMRSCGLRCLARPVTTCLSANVMQRRLQAIPEIRAAIRGKKVIFSDESMFRAEDMNGERRWVMDHEVPAPVRRDAWAAKVHVWGAICEDFCVLVFLDEVVNAPNYIETLKKHLLPHIAEHGKPEDYLFMQDNAPAHRASETRRWLSDNKIAVLPWPPYSPDLNPIENLWAIMKRRIESNCFHTKEDVTNEILRVWEELAEDMLLRLVASFPSRLDKCEAAKGDDIKMADMLP